MNRATEGETQHFTSVCNSNPSIREIGALQPRSAFNSPHSPHSSPQSVTRTEEGFAVPRLHNMEENVFGHYVNAYINKF